MVKQIARNIVGTFIPIVDNHLVGWDGVSPIGANGEVLDPDKYGVIYIDGHITQPAPTPAESQPA